ncbi:MAG: AbrB/MazE/SpoVT family DNA-binding domain-containing protein [Thermomicrobiales bacterium]|nr:AbrB/MazE/SpoVT family DNA-binding domain-containing protein [Thermomicrobiales bacterium]
MVAQRHLVRVQEKGQVTLPAKIRERLGIKKGDLVGIVETSEGVLITRQEVVAANALDRIGEALREQGVTLEELIESGRAERDQLLRDHYGIESDAS